MYQMVLQPTKPPNQGFTESFYVYIIPFEEEGVETEIERQRETERHISSPLKEKKPNFPYFGIQDISQYPVISDQYQASNRGDI